MADPKVRLILPILGLITAVVCAVIVFTRGC